MRARNNLVYIIRETIWPWMKAHRDAVDAKLLRLVSSQSQQQQQQMFPAAPVSLQSRFQGINALTDYYSNAKEEKFGDYLQADSLLWTKEGDILKSVSLSATNFGEAFRVEIQWTDPQRTFAKSFEPELIAEIQSPNEYSVTVFDFPLPPDIQLIAKFYEANANEGYWGNIEVIRTNP
jgi:hypothetical protein